MLYNIFTLQVQLGHNVGSRNAVKKNPKLFQKRKKKKHKKTTFILFMMAFKRTSSTEIGIF